MWFGALLASSPDENVPLAARRVTSLSVNVTLNGTAPSGDRQRGRPAVEIRP
jgi:hypothetical protein